MIKTNKKMIEKTNKKLIIVDSTENVITKGTGAGGSNTNKNGLPYEELTELKTEYEIISRENYYDLIKFKSCDKKFKSTKQSKLFKCMQEKINKSITKAHGCKNPDECFISEENKIIFIIEKKFQQVGGSVCEKIQTSDFKQWQYERTFPFYKIIYIYCLSEWFKKNCKAELEYLHYKKVPVFWGNDEKYKSKIIDYIINY